MIGRIVGNRYKLLSEMGSGGMAWVYLAYDLREGRQVAVKILYPHLAQDVGFLQRFAQEARLASSLSQSFPEMHVVTVLDYGSDRDVHYLVMEYVPGQDLRQILEQWETLTWQEALDVGRQVALALGHAHQHGVVHRDVKPENIMLLPNGVVRVLDFGVARARSSPALTQSGFVGSPYYAAPEQAMGQTVDIRADLYALGVVLYEMVAGHRPFQSDTPWAVLSQHIASPPPLVEASRPDLPSSVGRLIHKAMAKRPEDRFQSPAEMLQAIEAVLMGEDLPVESPDAEPEAPTAYLAGLYQQAQQAAEKEAWGVAVDLYSQILKLDARYRDVTEQLAEAGRQARLVAMYAAAQRALKIGDWAGALGQLDEIAQMAPGYRDVGDLQARARQKQELEQHYAQGIQHLDAGEWAAAITCLEAVQRQEAGYANVEQLLATARAQREAEDGPKQPGHRRAARKPEAAPEPRRNLLWGIVAVLLVALAVETYFFYRSQEPRAIAAVPSAPVGEAVASEPAGEVETLPAPVLTTVVPPTASAVPARATALEVAPATAITLPATTDPWVPLPPSVTPTPTIVPTAGTPDQSPPMQETLSGQIAFPRFDAARGTYDTYICRVDGATCWLVAAEASQPDFLADGSQLVVHLWKADDKGLLLLSGSGERIWKITDRLEAARPSADFGAGSYVFQSREESDRQPRLYRTEGTEVQPIVREAALVRGQSPAWLPDGRILYSGCWQDDCGILTMRADGTFPRQVVAGTTDTNPEASPDGQKVAFMSQREGNWDIYVVDADGSGLQRLTWAPGNDGLPAWSPDGRHIAFVSDRDGRWSVWAIHPDGSELQRLFDVGGPLDGRVHNAAPHETNGWVEERISWAPLYR
jgi:hypothetical protein